MPKIKLKGLKLPFTTGSLVPIANPALGSSGYDTPIVINEMYTQDRDRGEVNGRRLGIERRFYIPFASVSQEPQKGEYLTTAIDGTDKFQIQSVAKKQFSPIEDHYLIITDLKPKE